MKWSVPFIQVVQVQVAPQIMQGGTHSGRYYASLENDINTPVESPPLEKEQLGAIYDELVELAWENLEAGEIA